ncbi:hypothetical protein VIGAN_05223300 [Vigna angularis var. angularis]|uniref:Uncharacterized protein n=1 Tax=Vigna angularis var. angularis TaxID=157739 RepID=A0A0S3S754_PHAAN|nr:hypothetical protein VIGAN_05223300 [Vigna angularis var. angularis]
MRNVFFDSVLHSGLVRAASSSFRMWVPLFHLILDHDSYKVSRCSSIPCKPRHHHWDFLRCHCIQRLPIPSSSLSTRR